MLPVVENSENMVPFFTLVQWNIFRTYTLPAFINDCHDIFLANMKLIMRTRYPIKPCELLMFLMYFQENQYIFVQKMVLHLWWRKNNWKYQKVQTIDVYISNNAVKMHKPDPLQPEPNYISAKGSRVHFSVSHSLTVASGPAKGRNLSRGRW